MSDPDRQYRDLADLNPDAFIIQVEGKVVYCNQSARRMFRDGETVRLIGIDAIQLVAPDTRDFILKRRNRVLSTGEAAPYTETRHLRLDGTSFPSEMVVGQVTWGGRAGTMNIIHDITKRKQASEALRESEVRFSKAAEMAKIGHWVWDKIEDKAIYCSEALAKIYGVASGAELAAMCTSHVADLTWVHPDDRERLDEAVKTANESKRGFDIEYRIINAAGEVRHLHNIEEPVLDEHGEIIRSNGITQDITERKRAEETLRESEALFRALVDNLPVEIAMRDTKGRYLLVNPAWEKAAGRRHEDVIGATVQDVFAKEEADLYMAQDRAVLAAGRALDQEVEITREGDAHILHMIKFPIPDALGDIAGIGGIITDITERKQAEAALRKSRDQMRLITDNLPFAISYLDNERRYRFVNRTVETWFGRPAEEIYGQTIGDILGQEADDAVTPQVAAALRGEAQHDERVIGYPDGKTRTVELTYVPDFDESKTVRGCFALGQDITERKQAEAALRESEARLSKAAEMAKIGHWTWDEIEGRAIFCSEELAKIYGVNSGETLAASMSSFGAGLEWIHPEDRERFDRRFNEAKESKRGFEIEYRVLRRDGSVRYVHEMYEPILGEEGQLIRSNGVTQDITDRKRAEEALRESEERLREIINALPLALHVWAPDDRLVMVNKTHLEWWPEHTEAMRPGAHFSEHIRINAETNAVEGAEGRIEEYIEERLDQFHNSPAGATEVQLVNKRWLHVINNRLADGTTVQLHVDVTQERERELKLHQAQKMEAVGQLAGGTAHEINNLLQPIITFAKLTRDEVQDPELQHNLDRVLECGRRAKEIVADILTFARKVSGKPEAIEVGELMTATVRFVRALIPATIELRSEISADTGQALINRTEFTQVIINLVQNAADAIDRVGTISITTEIVDLGGHRATQRQLSDGRYCRVSVKDTGSGMASDTLKRIFEPFFTTKPAGKGTGLGLSVVYGIVTGWGGSVSAGSVVDEGSVFEVYIPLMQ